MHHARLHPASAGTPHLARGFTLIELLTVIAIIGILAAIVIPTVGKVRYSANKTRDLSNLRQLGAAALIASADNRDRFSPVRDSSGIYLDLILARYIGVSVTDVSSVFISPIAPVENVFTGTDSHSNYSFNGSLFCHDEQTPGSPAPVSVSKVAHPSRLVLAGNGSQALGRGRATATFWQGVPDSSWPQDPETLVPALPAQLTDQEAGHLRFSVDDNKACHAVMVDGSARRLLHGSLTYANFTVWVR